MFFLGKLQLTFPNTKRLRHSALLAREEALPGSQRIAARCPQLHFDPLDRRVDRPPSGWPSSFRFSCPGEIFVLQVLPGARLGTEFPIDRDAVAATFFKTRSLLRSQETPRIFNSMRSSAVLAVPALQRLVDGGIDTIDVGIVAHV